MAFSGSFIWCRHQETAWQTFSSLCELSQGLGLVVTRNVVALRRARLVLGWVTVRGYTGLVFNQSHPGLLSLTIQPWVGTMSTDGGLDHR